jgi:hypothetical protein
MVRTLGIVERSIDVYYDEEGKKLPSRSAAPENKGVTRETASKNLCELNNSGYSIPESLKHVKPPR